MYLGSHDLTWDAVQAVLQDVPDSACVIAEYVDAFVIDEMAKHTPSKHLQRLRAFMPDGDVLVMPYRGQYRVRSLGHWSVGRSLLSDDSELLNHLQPQLRKIYLWGERTEQDDEWIESNIPRYLRYPIQAKYARSRVQLDVEELCDSRGVPHFHRFLGLNEVKV